jgi:hypothetical protein
MKKQASKIFQENQKHRFKKCGYSGCPSCSKVKGIKLS